MPNVTPQALPWLIVWTGFGINAIGSSTRHLLGLVMPEMQSELGWSRSAISSSATLALVLLGFGGLFSGVMLSRLGRPRLLGTGVALIGVGMILSSLVNHSQLFVITFGLIAGLGFGLSAMPVAATLVAPYFSQRRGLALGIASAGGTLGPVVVIPLAALWLQSVGWRNGFMWAGMICLIAVPIVVLALRKGGNPTDAGPATMPSLGADFRQLVRSPVFHLLFWGFVACGFTSFGVIETHFIPYAAYCGFNSTTAANAFGVLSLFNMFGVVLSGWLSDRVNRPLLLASIYAIRALSFVLLINVGTDPQLLFLFALIFGLVDYATAPIVASLIASHLGLRAMGLAMGLISLGHQLGSALGALGGGVVFDLFNSYTGLWLISLVLAVFAALASIVVKPRAPAAAVAA